MRLYTVELAPNEKTWSENEAKDTLKQVYDEYLKERALVSEENVAKLLKTGRVRKVEYVGVLEKVQL